MSQHVSTTQPVISEAAFSGLFGRITAALDPYTEAAPVGVLVSLMAGFSAYVGHGPTVETGKGDSPLMFWPVLCGPSGLGRKGTATSIAMRVMDTAFKTFAEDNTVYGLPATGLGYIGELDERAIGGTGQPVLFIEEEMDTFISAARRDAKVGVYLRKSWDGQTVAHKTKHDDIKVKRPHISIIGHCQPKNWAAIRGTKDATGGTYNRFAVFYVFRSKTLPVFQATDSNEVIRQAARELRSVADFAREVDSVIVPKHVAEVFENKHRPICEALTSGSEELSQYTERAMAYMVRLAALYALSDKRDEISVRDFDAALALVSYSIDSIAFILPEAEVSEESSMAVKVETFVKEFGEAGCTATEIYRAFAIKASDLRDIVGQLDSIEVVKGEGTGRGRPPMLYRIVTPEASEMASEEIEEMIQVLADAAETTPSDSPNELIAEPTEAAPNVPSAVRDLRAVLEAAERKPETAAKPSGALTGVDALRAMLDALSAPEEPVKAEETSTGVNALRAILEGQSAPQSVTAETPKPVEKKPATTKRPRVRRIGTKVIPPVMFVAPSADDWDAILEMEDVA